MSQKHLFAEPIRLACLKCDREDFDGVLSVPDGWRDVIACEGCDEWSWWTHLGVCPECEATEGHKETTTDE